MNIDHALQYPLKDLVLIGSSFLMIAYGMFGMYLAYRKLEVMESHLNKCRLVEFHSGFWGSSPRGRMLRLGAVYAALVFTKRNARRGIIDLQQVQDFPKGMKYLLHCTAIFGLMWITAAAIFYFCYYLTL
ncbi:hypothetical protein [Pseudomonas sp. Z18(2022)]|uniref:hypothetical protein n=1 Tax=Pseudomonas sp. Z18(2022) TaxID=2983410 RepID=UPI002E80C2CE|nr:hypothetical protein [Pseudomonas sp. Z18(2022)]